MNNKFMREQPVLAELGSLRRSISQLFPVLASVRLLKRQRPPEGGHAARGIPDYPGDNKRRRVSLIKVPRGNELFAGFPARAFHVSTEKDFTGTKAL
jgi:hypothetical protein